MAQSQLAQSPIFNLRAGAAGTIRTCDPLLRRQMLYPTELQPQFRVSFLKLETRNWKPSLGGPSDRKAIHLNGGNTDADGNGLSIFTAGAYPFVKGEVISYHGNACEHIRSVAD